MCLIRSFQYVKNIKLIVAQKAYSELSEVKSLSFKILFCNLNFVYF